MEAVKFVGKENFSGKSSCVSDIIDDALRYNPTYIKWRNNIPHDVPSIIRDYRKGELDTSNKEQMSQLHQSIIESGFFIPKGQTLIHGGLWS